MKTNKEIVEEYMPLGDGEVIVSELQGNAYNLSANVLERILGFVERIMSLILGTPRKIIMVVTDNRVITVETKKMFWIIDQSVTASSFTPRSISRSGYKFSRDLLIFKSHYLEFHSGGAPLLIKSKKGKKDVYQSIKSIIFLAEAVSSKNK
jgi:hypothetical protein